jgi:flavodoxin
MKTLVVFYSYSGKTKEIAQALATEESAAIAEIKDVKHPGKLKAYIGGIVAAMRGKSWPIRQLEENPADYDRLILLAPVWAGNPPPPFYAFMEQLPSGKTIAVKMVSMSGKSDCKERLEAAIKEKSGTLESFEDIKASRSIP